MLLATQFTSLIPTCKSILPVPPEVDFPEKVRDTPWIFYYMLKWILDILLYAIPSLLYAQMLSSAASICTQCALVPSLGC